MFKTRWLTFQRIELLWGCYYPHSWAPRTRCCSNTRNLDQRSHRDTCRRSYTGSACTWIALHGNTTCSHFGSHLYNVQPVQSSKHRVIPSLHRKTAVTRNPVKYYNYHLNDKIILFVEVIIRLRVQFEIFKKYQNSGELNLNFLKNSRVQINLKLSRKVVWLLITYMKKFNGRPVTGSKGSCILCWMFGNSPENLGKSTGECQKPRFFENLWKSSDVFGNLWKNSEIVATTFQQFWIFC